MYLTVSRFLVHTMLSTGNRTPTPETPYIHSVISGNKSGALEAMGGSMKGRKESCSWSGLNRGLSHLERPVYSPSIMALIFWSLLSNSIHPRTRRLTLSPITHGTTKGPSPPDDVQCIPSLTLANISCSVRTPEDISKSQKPANAKITST